MAKNVCPIVAIPIPKHIYARNCWIESSNLITGLRPRYAFPPFFFLGLFVFLSHLQIFHCKEIFLFIGKMLFISKVLRQASLISLTENC